MHLAVVAITATLLIAAGSASAQDMSNMPANPLLPAAPPQAGGVNTGPFDPGSTASPYSRYGSPFSPNSIGNPFAAYGGGYSGPSPGIPSGTGMPVFGATP